MVAGRDGLVVALGRRCAGRRVSDLTLRRALALAALSALPALASTASAQEPQDTVRPDTVFTVEEIAVKVARPVATAGGASAIRAPLDSMRLPPAPTLEEVLRRMPLILIRENSRGEAQPQVRGMESRRVAVLVDGVPISLGWDNRADLSIIPLTAARRLTLVRGLSSVLHGPNALGGVLLVGIGDIPDIPRNPRPLEFTAGLDHLGNSAIALGLTTVLRGDAGDLLLRAGAGYRDRSAVPRPSDLDREVADQLGGLGIGPGDLPALPRADDERLNSDFEHLSGYVVARYQADGGPWLSLSSFGFGSERGVPPELHVAEPRLWRYPRSARWITALSAGTGWGGTPWGEGDLEASVGLDFGETRIDTYGSLAYDSITGGESGDDRTLSLRLLGDHTLGSGVLRGALTLVETRHIEVIDHGNPATFRQRFLSLGLEAEQPLLAGSPVAPRGRISLGASVDYSDTPETGGRPSRDAIWAWGARAGGTLALGNGSMLLNGGVSRRVRFPALRELYSGALGRFVVNPELDPEVLTVAELGLTVEKRGAEAQLVAFYQRLSDAIVRVSLGGGRLQRQNREVIRSAGVELLASYSWRGVSLTGDLTLKDVIQRDPSAPEGQRKPEYQPWIAGGLAVSAPLGLGVRGTGRLRHLGPRWCVHPDLDADVRLDSDTWLDLEFAWGAGVGGRYPGRRFELGLAALNLTDAAVFDQCGLPQPGRLVRLQLRIF
jgi:iron complex outermembrane receptor protein